MAVSCWVAVWGNGFLAFLKANLESKEKGREEWLWGRKHIEPATVMCMRAFTMIEPTEVTVYWVLPIGWTSFQVFCMWPLTSILSTTLWGGTPLPLFNGSGDWGMEKLTNLSPATQPVSVGARIFHLSHSIESSHEDKGGCSTHRWDLAAWPDSHHKFKWFWVVR